MALYSRQAAECQMGERERFQSTLGLSAAVFVQSIPRNSFA